MALIILYLRKNIFTSRAMCAFRSKTHRKYSSEPKPFKSIPGLSSLPLLGPLHHFLPVIGSIGPSGNMIAVNETLHKRFGPIVKLDGVLARAPAVILYDPEHYDQVFRAEEEGPLRPGFDTILYFQEQLKKSISKDVYGLTTAQGPKWRHFRSKVNPAMLKPKIVKLYAPVLKEISEDALKRWTKIDRDSMINNFNYEVTKWSLESVALIGLGDRIGCLDDDVTENHPAMQLIKCSKDIMDLCLKLEFLPIPWRYISTPNFKALMKTLHTQWSISEMYIKQAKRNINERGHDIPEEDKSIIEKLLAIDESVAVLMATEMLMAGIDTVAFSTIGLLYHLAVNQAKQEKLREQIRSGDPNQRYLKACLKETLRICPVVSANLRRTSKGHVVAGYRIPEGIDVIAPNQYLSNMEKHYIRPNEYIPERWLAEKTDPLYYGKAHPMVTLPFGFGVRSCIGRRIAELEIETLIKTLVCEVKVTWDGTPLNVVNRVVNSIKRPFHFKFQKL